MSKFDVDGDLVRKLATLLEETGLGEIEYARGEESIRVSRAGSIVHAPAAPALPTVIPAAVVEGRDTAPNGAVISPMVGTAYLAPEPGADFFVKVGDMVREGQTVCIIEAMKVMNQILAPRSGQVTRILVQNAQPVEYGEPLMTIE